MCCLKRIKKVLDALPARDSILLQAQLWGETMRTFLSLLAMLVILRSTVMAVDYNIHNPADKLENPAGRMSNPAERIYNPAGNITNPAVKITNPAGQMANPNPLSPGAKPAVQAVVQPPPVAAKPVPPAVPKKYYTFKKVSEYLDAAKKAFVKDDYIEFVAVTEDALRRIKSGGLKSSRKKIRQLEKYKLFGYSMLTTDDEP